MIQVAPELIAFLKEEYDRCRDDVLEDERTVAIDRYNGEPYGDEEDGSSQVVARDTAETVDYMVISILRTIISGERVVEFVHKDSEKAHEATETIMHLLMDEQDGYSILHDWLKAGLLEKNATAMAYPEELPKKRTELKLSASQLALAAEQGMEFIEAEETGETDPETGEPTFAAVTMQEQKPKFCCAAVPNEEVYCSPDARTYTEAALKGRRLRKTVSKLVEEGFDPAELEGVGDTAHDNTLSNARDEDRNQFADKRKGANRVLWWHEEFARYDLNEDGIAELLYIRRTGDFKVFEIVEMDDEDDHPFVDWCPFPMQHRRIGQSLADKVMDLERINTVVLRQTLNGFYLGNNPSTYVHEDSIGENTIDDLLTVRSGRLVRWKGNVAPVERSGTFDPSAGMSMIEMLERKRETRTGITRLNMGLDERTHNDTASGQGALIAKGEQMEEYVARNFANAVAKLITKLAKQLKRFGSPIEVPIDGEYVQVDPTQWPEDMIARARVGLGSTRKDQRMALRREVIGMQSAALEAGLSIVDDRMFFNSAKGFIAEASLGDVNEYFIEPPEPETDEQGNPVPKPEQPDPEMMKAQHEAQMAEAKMQGEQQAQAFKLQAEREAAAQRQQLARDEAEHQAALSEAKAQREADLAERKFAWEAQQAEQRMQLEERLATHKATLAQQATDAKLSQNRPGGDLSK
jgi:hypothetical protein